MKMLGLVLLLSLDAYKEFQRRKFPLQTFIATFACLPRFLKQSQHLYGEFRFERAFWVNHELNLKLFRIGQLEYELLDDGYVSIHIPSDVGFDLSEIKTSLAGQRTSSLNICRPIGALNSSANPT